MGWHRGGEGRAGEGMKGGEGRKGGAGVCCPWVRWRRGLCRGRSMRVMGPASQQVQQRYLLQER